MVRGPLHDLLVHSILLIEQSGKSLRLWKVHHTFEHREVQTIFSRFGRFNRSVQLLVVASQHEALAKLGGDPAGGLNRLSTLVNDAHIEALVCEFGVDVLPQVFVGS